MGYREGFFSFLIRKEEEMRDPINKNRVGSPTINPKRKGRAPNNIAQMIKNSANIRTNSGSGPKEPNMRQWYSPIIQKEPKASRAYSRAAQGGVNCKETP
jgi:hypothetical protein